MKRDPLTSAMISAINLMYAVFSLLATFTNYLSGKGILERFDHSDFVTITVLGDVFVCLSCALVGTGNKFNAKRMRWP